MSIGELFQIKTRIWRDQIRSIRRYYKNPRFALMDLSFGLVYFFSNPYRTCRKFLEKRGELDVYAYGETPLTTYEQIAHACGIQPKDHWLELGSGRGKGCFWIARFIGCQTTGIEWVPQFVRRARFLKSLFRQKNIFFEIKDMREVDFTGSTVVYLYGTCLSDEFLQQLSEKMRELPQGAKVISVSEPLDCERLTLAKTFEVGYPWGNTEAFLHIKS
jgi:hypothetical protein